MFRCPILVALRIKFTSQPYTRLACDSKRLVSATSAAYSTRTTRSSNQFTFSTKYPRQRPSDGAGKRSGNATGSGGKGKGGGGGKRMPGLALPARLRLATFKAPSAKPGDKKPTQPGRPGIAKRSLQSQDDRKDARAKGVAGHGAPKTQKLSPKAAQAKDEYDIATAKHTAKFSLSRTHFDNAKAETIANLEEQTREARFETMGLRPELVAAVKEVLAYDQPTQVQALCIPELLSNPEIPILCAAETGGGKTGAYLLPVINQLKQEEETLKAAVDPEESKRLDVVEAITSDGSTTSALSGTASVRKLRRPRAVIVVPSRELVAQVTATAKTICHRVRLRVVGAHAGMPASEMEEKIANAPVDLLITTPGSLNYLMRNAGFALSQTRHLVVDEADTMTDEDFGPELDTILKSATKFVNELDRPCQFVFVSATVPVTLNRMLQRHFPQVKRVTTASVHRTVPGLRQRFVRIDGSTSKQAMLIDLLKRAVIDDDRIIVFCNTRKSCELVGAHLKENGFDAHDISSNVDVKHRAKIFKEFSSPSTVAEGKEPSARKPMIVVATDIASRGVDTVNVGHVILFDFPQTAIDYLHRVGRTARNGAKGRATSIVAKKDRKLAEKIEEDVRRKQVLA